jgi:hypothetical protein
MMEVGGHLSGIIYYLVGDKKNGGGSVASCSGDIAVGRAGIGVIAGGADTAARGGGEVCITPGGGGLAG